MLQVIILGAQIATMLLSLVLGSVYVLDEMIFRTIDVYLPSTSSGYLHDNTHPYTRSYLDWITKQTGNILALTKLATERTYSACRPAISSPERIKSRGRRSNSLMTSMFMFALTLTRVKSADMNPNNECDRVHAYADVPVSLDLIEWQTGLPLWPQTVHSRYRSYRMQRQLRYSIPPWDEQVSIIDTEGPCPPCDSEPFFGGKSAVSPPETVPALDPILEDPVYGESPYFFSDKGDLVCMPTKTRAKVKSMNFDTDSGEIGIDNRCSACMSPHAEDFEGELTELKIWITGYGGRKLHNVYRGTIKWLITDDDGMDHELRIPNSYYVPDSKFRLISPQHWGQASKDDSNYCITHHDRTKLLWDGHTKTIPLDGQNVFTMQLATGYNNFAAFCTKFEIDTYKEDFMPEHLVCMPSHAETINDSGNEYETEFERKEAEQAASDRA